MKILRKQICGPYDEDDDYDYSIGEHDYGGDGEVAIDGGYDEYGYPEGENPCDDDWDY